ncbi:MAG: HAD-IIB family hydrolase [Acetivibrionales bacterium]|jgi:Cof subfamily protein (haloacid dehalogenase superfamily)
MNKYLFLSDIDGTLLRGESGIGPGVKKAAQEFMDYGGLLALCTGRSHVSTAWVAKELNIQIPCVIFSGAAIYDFIKKEFIWARPMENHVLESIKKVYDLYPDISIQIYTKDDIYLIRSNEHLDKYGVQEELSDSLTKLSDVKGEILKIVLVSKNRTLLAECGNEVFDKEYFHFEFASRHFTEIVASGTGKGNALHKLAQHYNVDIKNTFAAGDGMTDLPMLQAAGFSFAPEDAAQSLLDACNMKIPPCEQGGMEQAFNYAIEKIKSNL